MLSNAQNISVSENSHKNRSCTNEYSVQIFSLNFETQNLATKMSMASNLAATENKSNRNFFSLKSLDLKIKLSLSRFVFYWRFVKFEKHTRFFQNFNLEGQIRTLNHFWTLKFSELGARRLRVTALRAAANDTWKTKFKPKTAPFTSQDTKRAPLWAQTPLVVNFLPPIQSQMSRIP